MSGRFLGFRSSLASFRRRTCRRQRLPSAFETAFGPLGLEDLFWQKIRLSADSAPACTAETTQWLLAEFRFLANWPLYSPDLNSLDFSILCVLQAKVQATPHSNLAALCPSIAMKWDRLVVVYVRKTWPSFRCRYEKLFLNWLAYSPTHFNKKKYFSGLEEVLIRH